MKAAQIVAPLLVLAALPHSWSAETEPLFPAKLDVSPKPIETDSSVRWDYDIVYVRALRAGDEVHKRYYTDFSQPVTMEPGADLMLLHPDRTEERLANHCGGKIYVQYKKTSALYYCDGEHTRGSGTCLSFGSHLIDQVVSRELLKTVRPFQPLESYTRFDETSYL